MADIPKIRFKGFTEPWEQHKFAAVFDGLQNNTFSRAELNYESGTVKNVHYGDVLIKFGDYIDASETELPYISDDAKADKFKNSFLQDGDIIIADTAEDEAVGKCTEIQGSEGLKLLSGLHTIACRPKEKYGPMFLGYYINSPAYHNQLKPLMQGIKVTSISKSALQDTDMIMPQDIEEQEKIGAYFSTLDHLITLHQRKCDDTKELKKYMLQKMFPKNGEKFPEIRFKGFTEAWEQRKLGEVAKYRNGKAHENSISEDGEYIVVNSKFVSTDGKVRKFSDEQIEPLYKGEIAFVLSDVPNGRAIARTFLIDKNEKYTLNQRIAGITPKETTDSYFLHILMNRNKYFLKFDDGNKQTNLSINDVMQFNEMYPSYNEQSKIGAFFSNLDHLITLHQRKCDTLKELKKYMLQNMFPKKG